MSTVDVVITFKNGDTREISLDNMVINDFIKALGTEIKVIKINANDGIMFIFVSDIRCVNILK